MHGKLFSIPKTQTALFNTQVEEFIATENTELVEGILQAAELMAQRVRQGYPNFPNLGVNFDREVSLEALKIIVNGTSKQRPANVVINTAYNYIKELIRISHEPEFDSLEVYAYTADITSKLIMEEHLEDLLLGLPLRIKAAILYLLYHPTRLTRIGRICSFVEYVFLVRALFNMKENIGLKVNLDTNMDFDLPETQVSRLLLVSSLYKLSPATLVLLFLFKNLTSLFQFCILFGGKTIKVPKLDEIAQAIQRSSQLATRIEAQESTIADKESLALLATELEDLEHYDPNVELNPVLSAFFESMMGITLSNYERMQQKLVDSVDLSDPGHIAEVYAIMNKELTTQVNLMTEISGSVDTYKDLERIIAAIQQVKETDE